MFYDLCVPIPTPATRTQSSAQTKKNKGKQPESDTPPISFSASQIAAVEARIDLLVRLEYTTIVLNHTIQTKFEPKTHENVFEPLFTRLRKREGVLYLKRLTIVMDDESDKGNGLSTGNATSLAAYDIIALHPTTQNSLQAACLTHSQPSSQTAHIISLPLTVPRLPFRLKHTLVRTAIKNGAAFEICYAGALRAEDERRNWWTAARELVRVTKGKGLVLSSGCEQTDLLRAPRDVENLIVMLGLPQNMAHDAMTVSPRSLLLRAQTRKTYRAVLSEPTLIVPTMPLANATVMNDVAVAAVTSHGKLTESIDGGSPYEIGSVLAGKKRVLEQSTSMDSLGTTGNQESKKKKKKKAKTNGDVS